MIFLKSKTFEKCDKTIDAIVIDGDSVEIHWKF